MEEAQELSDHIATWITALIAQGTHVELVKIVGEMDRLILSVNTEGRGVMQVWRDERGEAGYPRKRVDKPPGRGQQPGPAACSRPRLCRAPDHFVDIQEPNLKPSSCTDRRALRD
jgi:hypothetical protein